MTSYRQVGGRLGAYIRANNPSTQQIQGLLSDLLANDPLLSPMRDVVQRQGFRKLLPLAGSEGGIIQRKALLNEIESLYKEEVLTDISETLNGILDLPSSRTLYSKNSSSHTQRANALPTQNALHRLTQESPAQAGSRGTNTSRSLFGSFAVASLIVGFLLTASLLVMGTTDTFIEPIPLEEPQGTSDNPPARQSTENQSTYYKTSISGKVEFPGHYIPSMNICAVNINTKSKICREMPESSQKYEYELEVPPGTYNVYFEVTDKEVRSWGPHKRWSGYCPPSRGDCTNFYIEKYSAAEGLKSLTANLDNSMGDERDGEPRPVPFVF